jgi:hypothetical protein
VHRHHDPLPSVSLARAPNAEALVDHIFFFFFFFFFA